MMWSAEYLKVKDEKNRIIKCDKFQKMFDAAFPEPDVRWLHGDGGLKCHQDQAIAHIQWLDERWKRLKIFVSSGGKTITERREYDRRKHG